MIGLTSQQQLIVSLVAQGLKNHEIARVLEISPGTIPEYLRDIYSKLGAKNRANAVAIALVRGEIVNPYETNKPLPTGIEPDARLIVEILRYVIKSLS